MNTSSRRNSTGTQLGEGDKDRKMRLVGDTNRRAERQLAKQIHDIDKHLQVHLRQINGDMEKKSSSTSSPLSSPSPKYTASSTDSGDSVNNSSPRAPKLNRAADFPNHHTQGEKRSTSRKQESSNHGETEGREKETKLHHLREKTFTIIDHGLSSGDADTATNNYLGPESKARGRTLDALDNKRLVQTTNEKSRKTNIRNEMASLTTSKSKTVRGEFSTSNRVQDTTDKINKNSSRHLDSKIPGQKLEQKGYLPGKIVPNHTGETLGYRKQAFNLNDSGNFRPRGTKISSNNNNGQILAKDEHDRRQLRKMHILSNLNKKHMNRDPSSEDMEVFIKRDNDMRSNRNVPLVPSPPGQISPDMVREAERPRPKSAVFSSHRRPRFTSDDDENVFLEDLDIIDIDDDGESSDDDDVLNSSFVAPLKPSSRHPLGLHTRSTSDISPSFFRRGKDSHFRTAKALHHGTEINVLNKSDETRESLDGNVSSVIGTSDLETKAVIRKPLGENNEVDKDKPPRRETEAAHSSLSTKNSNGNISPKSGTNNSFKKRNKSDISDKDSKLPSQDSGRPLPAFPRKLKPLFKPDNLNLSENTAIVSKLAEDETRVSDSASPTSPKSDSQVVAHRALQRASSNLNTNNKLQRSRQKTWTAGVGSRDLLKRPLPPTSLGPKPRVKSDLGDVMVRSVARRRARTSSELKKCSSKELETLKSGDTATPSVEAGNTSSSDKEKKTVEISEGLRNCRYLRSKTESEALTTVNVETC